MDCVIQITQLMKENFSINSSSNSHKFQTNTNCFSDLPYAIYVAENSSMVSISHCDCSFLPPGHLQFVPWNETLWFSNYFILHYYINIGSQPHILFSYIVYNIFYI